MCFVDLIIRKLNLNCLNNINKTFYSVIKMNLVGLVTYGYPISVYLNIFQNTIFLINCTNNAQTGNNLLDTMKLSSICQ